MSSADIRDEPASARTPACRPRLALWLAVTLLALCPAATIASAQDSGAQAPPPPSSYSEAPPENGPAGDSASGGSTPRRSPSVTGSQASGRARQRAERPASNAELWSQYREQREGARRAGILSGVFGAMFWGGLVAVGVDPADRGCARTYCEVGGVVGVIGLFGRYAANLALAIRAHRATRMLEQMGLEPRRAAGVWAIVTAVLGITLAWVPALTQLRNDDVAVARAGIDPDWDETPGAGASGAWMLRF